MTVHAWGLTDVGLKRASNQDSLLLDPDLGLYAVADGMGGHSGGEVASSMAIQTLQAVLNQERRTAPVEALKRAYQTASQRIFQRAQKESPELKGMGTTLVAVWVVNGTAYVGNVGDSRAYLIRRDGIWQLTEDHSLVAEQVRAGLIREGSGASQVGKNVITRSVGFEQFVECDVVERALIPGDGILLCSDGLSGLVTDRNLYELISGAPAEEVPQLCVEAAKKGGGDDNVTAIWITAEAVGAL